MNLADVREGLAERLETIGGAGVSSTIPSAVMQTPAFGIGLDEVEFDQDEDGGTMATYSVVCYLSRGGSDAWAQGEIDEYVPLVVAAVDADTTLSGAADFARVQRAEVLGTADVAGTSYVLVELTVVVWGT